MKFRPILWPGFWCRVGVVLVFTAAGSVRAQEVYEQDSVRYASSPSDDAVARLQRRLASGEVALDHNPRNGYLASLLKHLGVPTSSQSLVFSKTSFQRDRISPANPRALYFDDSTYVGWVPGADVLELAATDPNLGTIFYTLDQRPPDGGAARPAIERQTHSCLQCHAGAMTRDTPGLLVRSVFTERDGQPVLSAGTFLTAQPSPWSERWGGWYVTGTHGRQRHMGNAIVADESRPEATFDREAGANVTDLSARFDTSAYPAAGSDVVALMVLEHQAGTHNLLTRANHAAHFALRDQAAMNRALGRSEEYRSESTTTRIEAAGELLVRQMLFADEPPLTDSVAGTTSFADDFEARGPRDTAGRSLRDLDLKRRLFRYPCSYLIYSESFDALPSELKELVYRRLWQVLGDDDAPHDFLPLKRSQRRAIVRILAETKPGLPSYWKPLD